MSTIRQEREGAGNGSLAQSFAWVFRREHTLIWRLISLALVLGLWEIAGQIPINPAFPAFSSVLGGLYAMAADGTLWSAYGETLKPLAIGVAISGSLGVSIGIAMGLRWDAAWIGTPVFIVMQAAPMAAVIPLLTFVYGTGLTAKVIAVCLMASPPIVLNSYRAVSNVNSSLLMMCRSFLGNRRQEIRNVILPDASPMIFAGLRLGAAEGFGGAVIAELLITPTGIGDLITFHRSIAAYPKMYAAVFSIVVFTVVGVSLLLSLERILFRPDKKQEP